MDMKNYSKDYFELVQEHDRLLDKPLKTRQLTFFQDAMMRFTKNKYNVVATIILMIFILFSIFVPILTPTNLYTGTNSGLMTLPPRVPLLEKLGFLDGTKTFKDQPIDYSTIDPETGLGYPTVGFQADYIIMSSLSNEDILGSEKSPLYRGGTNDLFVNFEDTSFSVSGNDLLMVLPDRVFEIDINSINPDGVLKVYLSPTKVGYELDSWDEITLIGTINSSGITVIDPSDTVVSGTTGYLVFRYELFAPSENGNEKVSFNSVVIKTLDDVVVTTYSGYNLSVFTIFVIESAVENGRYVRTDAIMTVATFKYDVYSALFANTPATIGKVEYDRYLAENPGMAETIVVDPDNPNHWTFGEGFPVTEVLSVETRMIAGKLYTNYRVMMNGTYFLGFDSIPYFLFGTDVFGKDLFTLIWLGLRTSLLLGFMASIVNIVVGIVWGATSAYYGGQVDILMERFTDIWGSFPQITMIAIITVLIGPGFLALFIFVIYDGWIGAAKITRSQFYRYKGREYVLAARTLGASDNRIIFKHILPNALGTIITRVILSIPSIIFLEVNLSYLGFGIGNGQTLDIGPISLTGTSIGVILNDGQQQIFAGNLWLIIFPTIIVSILMITFNMFGNALRDALNPQLRGTK